MNKVKAMLWMLLMLCVKLNRALTPNAWHVVFYSTTSFMFLSLTTIHFPEDHFNVDVHRRNYKIIPYTRF